MIFIGLSLFTKTDKTSKDEKESETQNFLLILEAFLLQVFCVRYVFKSNPFVMLLC